jgi:hypothetical protein
VHASHLHRYRTPLTSDWSVTTVSGVEPSLTTEPLLATAMVNRKDVTGGTPGNCGPGDQVRVKPPSRGTPAKPTWAWEGSERGGKEGTVGTEYVGHP